MTRNSYQQQAERRREAILGVCKELGRVPSVEDMTHVHLPALGLRPCYATVRHDYDASGLTHRRQPWPTAIDAPAPAPMVEVPSWPPDYKVPPEPEKTIKISSYPWYFADWRSSAAVRGMTAGERGIFRELLDYTWELGSLPAAEEELKRLAGASDREWRQIWPNIKSEFTEKSGRLVNEKVEQRRPEILRLAEARKQQTLKARTAKAKRRQGR